MVPPELLAKVRQIEIKTNRLVTELLSSQYTSAFKGNNLGVVSPCLGVVTLSHKLLTFDDDTAHHRIGVGSTDSFAGLGEGQLHPLRMGF